MKRAFLRGYWNDAGIAIPDAQASELDNVIPMRRSEDYHQGRNATNPVPSFSMLAGKPIDSEEECEHAARALFWQSYVGCIALIALVSAAIKVLG